MKIRIGLATYGLLDRMSHQIPPGALPDNVELIRLNMVLSDLAVEAVRLEKNHSIDAFVASGGNEEVLSRIISSTPIVRLVPTGFDVIEVLKNASLNSRKIGFIFFENSYASTIRAMSILKDLTGLPMEIRSYSTHIQLQNIVREFMEMGITDVIGGSLALHIAAENGLNCHYLITQSGLIEAIRIAVRLVETRHEEADLSRHLYSILDFISEGIIAINQDDQVSVCNPSAEKILGINRANAIGKSIESVLPGTRLKIVRNSGIKELNQIQEIGSTRILTNRIPIIIDGAPIGALATFRYVQDVENAEAQIRHDLYSRGLVAKHTFKNIIGSNPVIRHAIDVARQYAAVDATVLIDGDSGTGKELFAQSIHSASPRHSAPFVAINCASMPPQLLESELFGYEEGAFTGARRGGKRGLFELADGGSLFLDEISEISFELQARLLRILEQREVMRLGSERIRKINIRVICATNKDLAAMVSEGTFRKDLYYRINVLSLHLPPLSQRKDDIPELADFFLKKYCPSMDETARSRITCSKTLLDYNWPGNIRELRNTIENFSATSSFFSDSEDALKDILSRHYERSDAPTPSDNKPAESNKVSDTAIQKALTACAGNQTKAAKQLGISRSTLWRRLREQKAATQT